MRRLCVFLVAGVAALEASCGGSASLVGPGGKIGAMTLAAGTVSDADEKFFDLCKANVPKPGRYERSFDVRRVPRLFIGPGYVAPTRKATQLNWRRSKWAPWVDGRSIDLPAFGTSDRVLLGFPPAGGKDVSGSGG